MIKDLPSEKEIISKWEVGDLDNPIVSISCLTYNHEKYIRDALEGFLMQDTTYAYQICVLDDASTDDNVKIIREYANKYPNLFKCFFLEENTWGKQYRLERAKPYLEDRDKAKYIALCEGDDYWTDPFKLQKQVDFLEANPEYGMVSSDINLIDENGDSIPDIDIVLRQRRVRKPEVNFFDLLECNTVNTLTTCIRADLMKQFADRANIGNLWFVHDYWYWLNIAINYKIKISYEKTAAYREHANGTSKQKNFLSSRLPLIKYDVIRSFCRKKQISTLKKEEISILVSTIFSLLMSKYLTWQKKLLLIKIIVTSHHLAYKSISFVFIKIMNRIK